MRPRPEGRGEPSRARGTFDRRRDKLQCGHDPKAVENRAGLACNAHELLLQCGHDPKAVENNSTYRSSSPWPPWLQCGHDPKAVENPSARPTVER